MKIKDVDEETNFAYDSSIDFEFIDSDFAIGPKDGTITKLDAAPTIRLDDLVDLYMKMENIYDEDWMKVINYMRNDRDHLIDDYQYTLKDLSRCLDVDKIK